MSGARVSPGDRGAAMTGRRLAWAMACGALWIAPAHAQSVAAQAGAEALARRCAAAGGRPSEKAGLVRSVALGGRRASVLDPQRLTCASAAPVDCGPFGCKLSVYFEGVAPVFETHVKAWRARAGQLEILRVGAYCAGTGESCSETYRVEGEGLALAGKGNAIFARDAAPAPAAAQAPPKRSRPAARETKGRVAAGRPTPRGRFDAVAPPQTEPDAGPAPTPIAPGATAERRRKLDAAPYVP